MTSSGGDRAPTYHYGHDAIPGERAVRRGLWRYSRLLPFDGSDLYPLEVGGTPLVRATRLEESFEAAEIWLKDETRGPTGSNKDRATALCCVDALVRDAPVMVCASTGNVAASLSVGGAAVGIPVFVFVAAGQVSRQKEILMRAMGATVVEVDGSYSDAYKLSESVAKEFGWYSRNTGDNPLCLQGKKTVAFEIWEELDRTLPNVIYAPVGDGVTLAALATGFGELVECGLTSQIPQIIGVQAEGASPLVEAFRSGERWEPVSPSTIADGIAVGDPRMGDAVLEAVHSTGGTMIAVSDQQIRNAVAMVATRVGLLVEPAGAAALAGLMYGESDREERGKVVVLVTGTGFKDHRYWPPATAESLESGATIDSFPIEHALAILSRGASGSSSRGAPLDR